ncbi:hypothetical protein [Streptomyces sp. XD-27]|uniref:hypothetical protein n=1 Tax=Streptomyces sp. XD-27 TaxID=3062779 RepID=UPI0026F45908|nr:hypothetical protein [Streptomyces sp. XD-27]WKX69487.1 hypothetical protein Q3Y56_05780 [Streptomyces sp. XD-27]
MKFTRSNRIRNSAGLLVGGAAILATLQVGTAGAGLAAGDGADRGFASSATALDAAAAAHNGSGPGSEDWG